MAGKYKELIEHDSARGADMWDELPDTTNCTLPDWVVEAVLKQIKEDRAPGEDDTPITLYIQVPEAQQLLIKLVTVMWQYELLPAHLPTLIQVMIHKAGQARTARKNYRPITLPLRRNATSLILDPTPVGRSSSIRWPPPLPLQDSRPPPPGCRRLAGTSPGRWLQPPGRCLAATAAAAIRQQAMDSKQEEENDTRRKVPKGTDSHPRSRAGRR